jgi:hypothetical protein
VGGGGGGGEDSRSVISRPKEAGEGVAAGATPSDGAIVEGIARSLR